MSVLVHCIDTRLFVLGFQKKWRFGVEPRMFERRSFCFFIQPYESILDGLSKCNENFSGRRSRHDVEVVEPPQISSTLRRLGRS